METIQPKQDGTKKETEGQKRGSGKGGNNYKKNFRGNQYNNRQNQRFGPNNFNYNYNQSNYNQGYFQNMYNPYYQQQMLYRTEMYIYQKYNHLIDINTKNAKLSETLTNGSQFFVIKSFSEENVHKSIKYGVWSSSKNGNLTLSNAFRNTQQNGGNVYLFFSCNGSGRYVGLARMKTPCDVKRVFEYWTQDGKWPGLFEVEWLFIKDVPFKEFKEIIITMRDGETKPISNARDTQEIPFEQAKIMVQKFENYQNSNTILEHFEFYDLRQDNFEKNKQLSMQMQKNNQGAPSNNTGNMNMNNNNNVQGQNKKNYGGNTKQGNQANQGNQNLQQGGGGAQNSELVDINKNQLGSSSHVTLKSKISKLEDTIEIISKELNDNKEEIKELDKDKTEHQKILKEKTEDMKKSLLIELKNVEVEMKKHLSLEKDQNSQLQKLITQLKGEKTVLLNKLIALQRRITDMENKVGQDDLKFI